MMGNARRSWCRPDPLCAFDFGHRGLLNFSTPRANSASPDGKRRFPQAIFPILDGQIRLQPQRFRRLLTRHSESAPRRLTLAFLATVFCIACLGVPHPGKRLLFPSDADRPAERFFNLSVVGTKLR